MRVRLKPLPVMTAFAIAALIVLVMLGQWQWTRYRDKNLAPHAAPTAVVLDPVTPLPEGLQLVYGVRDGAPGWRVLEPVRYGERVVFVDADFIVATAAPDWRTVRPPRAIAAGRGVSGVIVHPRPAGAFAAKSDPERRVWFTIDLQAMGAAAGLDGVENYLVAMPYLDATGAAVPNPFAQAGGANPLPPERHLGYALTWWGLAAALIGVYLAFHARQGRLTIR